MERRRALKRRNIHPGLGLIYYAVIWLLMDRYQPAMWVWGVVGTLCALCFACSVIDIYLTDGIDLDDIGRAKPEGGA